MQHAVRGVDVPFDKLGVGYFDLVVFRHDFKSVAVKRGDWCGHVSNKYSCERLITHGRLVSAAKARLPPRPVNPAERVTVEA